MTSEDGSAQFAGQAVSLFYPLDDAAFVTFLQRLRELKKDNVGNPPLAIHPVMDREGLDGPWARRFKTLLLSTVDSSKLSKVTFMATGRSDGVSSVGANANGSTLPDSGHSSIPKAKSPAEVAPWRLLRAASLEA